MFGLLLEKLSIGWQQVVACGNGFNDIPLISRAGHGAAMVHAQPKVKRTTRGITRSNNEDGVAFVVARYWPGQSVAGA